MEYSQEEFFALIESAEDQGGELLDRLCAARRYEFCGAKQKPMTLPSCGNSTIFEVPYNAADRRGKEVGSRTVQACAVDDDMGRWPRFGGDRFAEPQHFIKPKDSK